MADSLKSFSTASSLTLRATLWFWCSHRHLKQLLADILNVDYRFWCISFYPKQQACSDAIITANLSHPHVRERMMFEYNANQSTTEDVDCFLTVLLFWALQKISLTASDCSSQRLHLLTQKKFSFYLIVLFLLNTFIPSQACRMLEAVLVVRWGVGSDPREIATVIPLREAHLSAQMFPVQQKEIFWCLKLAKVRVRRWCTSQKSYEPFFFMFRRRKSRKRLKKKCSLWCDWVVLLSLSPFTARRPICNENKLFFPNFTLFFTCPKQQNIWFCVLFFFAASETVAEYQHTSR